MREITSSTFAGNYTKIVCNKCRKVIREWLDTALHLGGGPGQSIDICEECRGFLHSIFKDERYAKPTDEDGL